MEKESLVRIAELSDSLRASDSELSKQWYDVAGNLHRVVGRIIINQMTIMKSLQTILRQTNKEAL